MVVTADSSLIDVPRTEHIDDPQAYMHSDSTNCALRADTGVRAA
jgi:hypothetical protein